MTLVIQVDTILHPVLRRIVHCILYVYLVKPSCGQNVFKIEKESVFWCIQADKDELHVQLILG